MIPDFDRLRQAEEAADVARGLAHRREALRHGGVAWSGLALDPFDGRTPEALSRDASDRLAALHCWRRSRAGGLLAAMVRAERAVGA